MSWSSSPKYPDSPTPISTPPSPLQFHSLSSTLPDPSSSLPEPEPDQPTPPSPVISPHLGVKDSDVESDESLWDLYERWMAHCKVSRSLDEKQKRFAAFKENAKFINLENKTENYPYKLALNVYSDMTNEEFESKQVRNVDLKHLDIKDSDLKSDKSLQRLYNLWRTRYHVSRSCTEKLKRFSVFKQQAEFIHSENKKGTNIYKLGLNQFSDMTSDELERNQMGSSPGPMLQFYRAIMEDCGILSEDDYNQGKMDGLKVKFDGYGMVPLNGEETLQEAVNKHPVCVFIDARGDAFKNYRGGVLTEEVGKEPEFTVAVIGYGFTPNGVMYWEIHNCWGQVWGEGGFMRIKKGVNLLGIASFAIYPIINKPSFNTYCELCNVF